MENEFHHVDGQIHDLVFDDASDRLFASISIANFPERSVAAFAPDDVSVYTTIDAGFTALTVALDEGRHRLYVVSGQNAQAVSVIDTSNDIVLDPLTEGPYIQGVVVDPVRDRQWRPGTCRCSRRKSPPASRRS